MTLVGYGPHLEQGPFFSSYDPMDNPNRVEFKLFKLLDETSRPEKKNLDMHIFNLCLSRKAHYEEKWKETCNSYIHHSIYNTNSSPSEFTNNGF